MSAGGSGMDDSMEETTGAAPLRQAKGEFNDKLDKLRHRCCFCLFLFLRFKSIVFCRLLGLFVPFQTFGGLVRACACVCNANSLHRNQCMISESTSCLELHSDFVSKLQLRIALTANNCSTVNILI